MLNVDISVYGEDVNEGVNKLTVSYQYKKSSEKEYSEKVNIIDSQVPSSILTWTGTISPIDSDSVYNVLFTATDTLGSVVTKTISVPTEYVSMDFYNDGTGVGFGRVAPASGIMAINMDTIISETGVIGNIGNNDPGVYLRKRGIILVEGSDPFIMLANTDNNEHAYISINDGYLTLAGVKLYYKYGDTITLTGTVGGAITNSKKSVLFKIMLGKPTAIGNTATITSLKLSVRQNAAYIVGSASGTAEVTGYTGTFSPDDCSINVSYVASAALANSINNAPCGVSYEATIKFE